jgi:hypothetical protein
MGDMTMKKNQKRLITLAIMMAASPLYAASLNEIEANHPVQSAQYLTINDKVTEISSAIGVLSETSPVGTKEADLDYYSFYAQAGDVVTVDIDGGYGGVKKVDTIAAIFDADYKLLRMNDDASSIDEGSSSRADSRIDNFKIATSGIYHVGISSYPRFFSNGGGVTATSTGKGDYKLVISGVSPSVIQISIDVKPGSSDSAPINPKSKGKIPVALLSDSNFNAMDIDPATVTFGKTGNEASLSMCNPAGRDVNGDGLLDLVCHFDNQAANFDYDSLEGIARGSVRSSTARGAVAFEGHGLLKVVPTLTK